MYPPTLDHRLDKKPESVLSELGPVSGLPVHPITAVCQVFEFFLNPGASMRPGWTRAEPIRMYPPSPARQQSGAHQRRDDNQQVPPCTAMLFRNGEVSVFQAWRLPFGASFLSAQKATLGMQAAGLLRPFLARCFGIARAAFFSLQAAV